MRQWYLPVLTAYSCSQSGERHSCRCCLADARALECAGKPRGYLRLGPQTRPSAIAFTLSVRGAWESAAAFICNDAALPQLLLDARSTDDVVDSLLGLLPMQSVSELFRVRSASSITGVIIRKFRLISLGRETIGGPAGGRRICKDCLALVSVNLVAPAGDNVASRLQVCHPQTSRTCIE